MSRIEAKKIRSHKESRPHIERKKASKADKVATATEGKVLNLFKNVRSLNESQNMNEQATIATGVAEEVFDLIDEPEVRNWIFERVADWDSASWMENIRDWWNERTPFVKNIILNSPVPNPATNIFRVLVKAGLIDWPELQIVDMQKTEKWSMKIIIAAVSYISAQPELTAIIPICEKIMDKQNSYFQAMREYVRMRREEQTGQMNMFPEYDQLAPLNNQFIYSTAANDNASIWNQDSELAA